LYTAGKFTFLSYIRRVSEQNISSSKHKDKQNISWDGNVLQGEKRNRLRKSTMEGRTVRRM
jgi:hypothetical protein